MNEYAVDTPDNFVSDKRPTFLTVLCILTFVVSGYHIIMAIIDLFSSKTFDATQWEDISNQMAEAMSGADSASQEMANQMMVALSSMMQAGIDNALALAITAFVASGLSILGAYWMFNLKKIGYYTYIAAKVIGIIIPLIIFGVNILTMMMFGFITVIAGLFIVLYGIHRKYMH